MEVCQKCNGTGFIATGPSFVNQGELPGGSIICEECNGKGSIPSNFFTAIIFKSKTSNRTYWMPLFVLAEKVEEAQKIINLTLNGLQKEHEIIHRTHPILETDLTSHFIKSSFDMHRMQKLCFLTATVWKLVDIKPKLELSFDDNLKFVIENMPLVPRKIAECVEQHKFPVRVIKEGLYKFDFTEFLIIDVIRD